MKLKKVLSILLVAVMLLSVMPFSAFAASSGTFDTGLSWNIDDNGKLTFSGSGAIPEAAFRFNYNYTEVVIDSCVTAIGEEAFRSSSVEKVTVSANFASAPYAFVTDSLTSVTFEEGVTTIPSYMFVHCYYDPGFELNLPSTLERIESEAFYNCKITSVTIPEGTALQEDSFVFEEESAIYNMVIEGNRHTFAVGQFDKLESNSNVQIYEGCKVVGTIPGEVTVNVAEGCSQAQVAESYKELFIEKVNEYLSWYDDIERVIERAFEDTKTQSWDDADDTGDFDKMIQGDAYADYYTVSVGEAKEIDAEITAENANLVFNNANVTIIPAPLNATFTGNLVDTFETGIMNKFIGGDVLDYDTTPVQKDRAYEISRDVDDYGLVFVVSVPGNAAFDPADISVTIGETVSIPVSADDDDGSAAVWYDPYEDGDSKVYQFFVTKAAFTDSMVVDYTPSTPTTYTITWKNGDEVLDTTEVEEGTVPTFPGAAPTKEPDKYYTYTFSGWTPAPVAATEDTTYTAAFTATAKTFTVFVKTLTGKTIFVHDVTGETTAAQIKDMLVQETGLPAAQQRLIFAGTEMANDKTLADCNVEKESIIHLSVNANNGSSLTLNDGVNLNVYLDADAYGLDENAAVVKVTYNHNADVSKEKAISTDTIPLTEATRYIKLGDPYSGTYKFSFKMAPAQFAEDVTIELYASEDAQTAAFSSTTNVKAKCDQVINLAQTNDAYATYATLCGALEDYCVASQVYFNYDAPATPAYNNAAVTTMDASDMEVPTASVGIDAAGFSFTVVSGLEVNVFYTGDLNVTGVSIDSTKGADSVTAATTAKGNKSCINIKGIASGNMDNLVTVTTTAGDVSLAATNIAKAIAASSNNINYVNLARALYLYSVQASAYFGC